MKLQYSAYRTAENKLQVVENKNYIGYMFVVESNYLLIKTLVEKITRVNAEECVGGV